MGFVNGIKMFWWQFFTNENTCPICGNKLNIIGSEWYKRRYECTDNDCDFNITINDVKIKR